MPLSRRQFLKYLTVSAGGLMVTSTGTVLFQGQGSPDADLLVESPVRMPEDLVSGRDTWYASLCRLCPAGCGIIVRVMEGRAKKVEGNPDHPVARGKLCALGQAGVQLLYHPDRLKNPLRRVGERGSGRFEEVSWEAALAELIQRLKELRANGNADGVVLVTEALSGHLALVVSRFAQAYGASHLAHEPGDETVFRSAVKTLFGQERLPHFDLAHTRYLLSFGADFLGSWLSPVSYGRGYGEFRQGEGRRRGTLVQIEPRLSLTGANADEWLPLRPGTEGVLALSLAQVIVAEGLGEVAATRALTGGRGAAALEAFAPEAVASTIGISAHRIREVARRFATQRPSLAIGGGPAAAQTNGSFNLRAILALNFLAGSLGQPGGLYFNSAPPLAELSRSPEAGATSFSAWPALISRLERGQPKPVQALLVHQADPLFDLPQSLGLESALGGLAQRPYLVAFSSFMNQTAYQADLILPTHFFLEDWGSGVPDPGPGYQTLTLQQPAINPLFPTRSFADLLLTVAKELGGEVGKALPQASLRQLLREEAEKLFRLGRGSVKAGSAETFWLGSLQRGGWWDQGATALTTPPRPPELPSGAPEPTFAGDATDFPFHLLPFVTPALRGNLAGHAPWLQATGDPLTTVAWQTWLEVNPDTARRLGLEEGDVVVVESSHGALEVPVYPHRGVPPDVVAMPWGRGHLFGQFAQGRGANPAAVLAPLTDAESGALAWGATRVRLKPTGRRIRLPRLEGSVPAVQLPGKEVVELAQPDQGG